MKILSDISPIKNSRGESICAPESFYCPNSKCMGSAIPIMKAECTLVFLCVCCNIEWDRLYTPPPISKKERIIKYLVRNKIKLVFDVITILIILLLIWVKCN